MSFCTIWTAVIAILNLPRSHNRGCCSWFTIEFEQNNAIPFLDILVTRIQNNAFMTSIYRKKTFTGLYTKWDSFTPRKYKINLIRSLTYRYYRLCSSGSLLQSALNDLRKLLLQNGYPQGIINYHVNDVLNKNRQHQHSDPVSTVPKKDIVILPRGGTWVHFCWVCAAGLSEPLPHYSLFRGQV